MFNYNIQHTSVNVPVDIGKMSPNNLIRFRQIIGRDKRVIKRYLGIIRANKDRIVIVRANKKGKRTFKINSSLLHKMTNTTKERTVVQHDLKSEFPRISPAELTECRREAEAIFLSHVRGEHKRPPGRTLDKFNRYIGHDRFTLDLNAMSVKIIDSMDTMPLTYQTGRKRRHAKLEIPLKLSKYHREKICDAKVVSLKIFKNSRGKFFVNFNIKNEIHQIRYEPTSEKEIGVLGIDLGINKPVCTVLLTSHGISKHKFISSIEMRIMLQAYKKFDKRIKKLQKEASTRQNLNTKTDSLFKVLRKLASKKRNIKTELDHKLTSILTEYIKSLSVKYDLFIVIGDLKNIRRRQYRGNGNKKFRKVIHEWSFYRISTFLEYKLRLLGYGRRFAKLSEAWTSIRCWKCNQRGVRPKQSYFKCINQNCKWQGNADVNGAVNIAKRGVKYFKLTNVVKTGVGGLGFAKPKASFNHSQKSGCPSRNGTAVNQGRISLLDEYFEGDQLMARTTENSSLMKSTSQELDREESGNTFSKEKKVLETDTSKDVSGQRCFT